ncbi:MAG TPA: hypothetical protein VE442_18400 [Jatrophihabitans sp.]|jgi:hypothetical protein|nr:hypothetical protein [Jatrophihabitans sp.]
MRLLRGLAGTLLWLGALLLGLVAVLLCATVILLPLGVPLLGYARRMFGGAVRLMLPRAVAHPVETSRRSFRKGGRKADNAVAAVTTGKAPRR